MHSSRMRTARSSSRPGGVSTRLSPPKEAQPQEEAPPLEEAAPREEAAPPGGSTPLWIEFLTHTSENITLPQTSFAGGKNVVFVMNHFLSCPRSEYV